MNAKSLLSSKTFWFNVLSGLGQVAGLASGFVPPAYAAGIAGAQAIINILLRLVTNQPVTVP